MKLKNLKVRCPKCERIFKSEIDKVVRIKMTLVDTSLEENGEKKYDEISWRSFSLCSDCAEDVYNKEFADTWLGSKLFEKKEYIVQYANIENGNMESWHTFKVTKSLKEAKEAFEEIKYDYDNTCCVVIDASNWKVIMS